MINKDYFDVLTMSCDQNSVDIIQAVMGDDCLGTFFQNGTTKLYFNSGIREKMDVKLGNLFKDQTLQWEWEIQVYEDWHLTWQDQFKPVLIENKLAVIPYWENNYFAEITIRIKPGMAFGTGHHETTRLMLETLLKENLMDSNVLDMGTGSGILSIASAKLGAKNISAIEIDPVCKDNFFENLELNELRGQIDFYLMDVLQWTDFNYQYILVNMNRNIILKCLPEIQIPQDGKMFLTGILNEDEKEILDVCLHNNLKVIGKQARNQWICLTVISL